MLNSWFRPIGEKSAVADLDHPSRSEWPPKHYHCKRDEHDCRPHSPFRVHAEPGDFVGFEESGFPGEGMGLAEGVTDSLLDGAAL